VDIAASRSQSIAPVSIRVAVRGSSLENGGSDEGLDGGTTDCQKIRLPITSRKLRRVFCSSRETFLWVTPRASATSRCVNSR